jgi:hypothetical protein
MSDGDIGEDVVSVGRGGDRGDHHHQFQIRCLIVGP